MNSSHHFSHAFASLHAEVLASDQRAGPTAYLVHEHLVVFCSVTRTCEPDQTQPTRWPLDGKELATLIASLLAIGLAF
jgi:hypothetical protein